MKSYLIICHQAAVEGREGGKWDSWWDDPSFLGATLSGGCRDKHLPIISHQHFQEPLSKNKTENTTIMFSFNLLTKKPSKACELGENENRDEAIVCETIGCFLYFLPRGIISAVTNNNLQFTLHPSVDAKKQHYAINGLDIIITHHDERGAISF